MDYYQADDFGDGAGGDILNAARAQTLRYSNFFLTISTNVRPHNEDEKDGLVEWLLSVLNELFTDWDLINGNLIKPPGTRNEDRVLFPENNKIIKIKTMTSIEQGDFQNGQVHAHVIMEVAHRYLIQEDGAEGHGNDTGKAHLGVHVNVWALRTYLNDRIERMDIADDRKPPKIYVNSKLLTKGTDNSNKFLTLQYINKDRAKDNDGGVRNLRRDQERANPNLALARESLLNGGMAHGTESTVLEKDEVDWRDDEQLGMGGALSPVAPHFVVQGLQPPSMVYGTVPIPKFVKTTRTASGPKSFKK
jgi:hypothetical protein